MSRVLGVTRRSPDVAIVMNNRPAASKKQKRLPRYERHAELVATAAKLVAQGGLEALEFTAIAAAAGVKGLQRTDPPETQGGP